MQDCEIDHCESYYNDGYCRRFNKIPKIRTETFSQEMLERLVDFCLYKLLFKKNPTIMVLASVLLKCAQQMHFSGVYAINISG